MTTSSISEIPQVKEEKKFCCDCKFLLGLRHRDDLVSDWKCVHPNNLTVNKIELDLVLGVDKYIREYREENIYKLRETYCGKDGIWYEEYIEPDYSKREPTIGGKEAVAIELEVFDAETLEKNRQAAREAIELRKKQKLTGQDFSNL